MMAIHEIPRSFPNKTKYWNINYQIQAYLLGLSFIEKLKIFEFISKHILCYPEKFTMRKNIYPGIRKCVHKFVNPQNSRVTNS